VNRDSAYRPAARTAPPLGPTEDDFAVTLPDPPPSSAEHLRNLLEFEGLISELSSRFINLPPGDLDREIEDALRRVSEAVGLDLAILWQWDSRSWSRGSGPLALLGEAALEKTVPQTLADAEREHILRALERAGGRIKGPKGAAAALGMNYGTLYGRMKKLGIRRQE
jgi:DNA-binding NtrC family response regulator